VVDNRPTVGRNPATYNCKSANRLNRAALAASLRAAAAILGTPAFTGQNRINAIWHPEDNARALEEEFFGCKRKR
jgi:hypothetical protein